MPKVVKLLTDREVKKVSAKLGDHCVGGVTRLLLRVTKTGAGLSRNWQIRRQGIDGFRMQIGRYPDMSVDEARQKAAEILKESGSENPVEEKRKRKAQRIREKREQALKRVTVADLMTKWLNWKEARGEWKNSLEARYKAEQRLSRHVLPKGGGIVVADATPEDIAELLQPIWLKLPATSDILLMLLKNFFMWAAIVAKVRDPQKGNPAQWEYLKPLLPSKRMRRPEIHFPYLEPDQLPWFFRALVKRPGVAARCTEFAILTCVRSGNARFAKWDQFDLDKRLWTIDPEDMKVTANGQHIVPLSDQATAIIRERLVNRCAEDGEWVFASPRRHKAALGNTALNTVIKDLHTVEVKAGREGWIDRKQSKKTGRPVIAVQHAVSRATFESWAHSVHANPRAIQLILHHDVDPRLKSAYDRDESLDDKKLLLQKWADFCYSKVEDADGSKQPEPNLPAFLRGF